MIAILTAVYDDYDTLKAMPAQSVDCETIAVTDNPNLHAEGWDTVVYERRLGVHPNRAAKRPKCCPWNYTDADTVIWIDASFQCQSAFFAQEAGQLGPIAQTVHPDRDCIYTEGEYSTGLAKYEGEPIADQMRVYLERGHPQHWGLWATGIIVRQRSLNVEAFGNDWLTEIEQWSFQDQVSEPYVLRDHGLRPQTLPGGYHQNPWLIYAGSARH